MSLLNRITPRVDPSLLQKAVESFAERLSKASAGDNRTAICVGACALIEVDDGFLIDHQDMFRDVGDRLCALDDVICAHRDRITAEKRFPGEWVEIAASAKLVGGSFDPSLFSWPTEAEAVQS